MFVNVRFPFLFLTFIFIQIHSHAQDVGSLIAYGGGLSNKIIDYGTVSADGVETVYIGAGAHVINGTWEIYSKYIVIDSGAVISGDGTIFIYNPLLAGALSGPTFIDANNSNPINVKIDVRNTKGMILKNMSFPDDLVAFGWVNNNTTSSLYIGKELSLGVDSVFVYLDSAIIGDLRFDNDAVLTNYTPNRFIVTNNSIKSHLIKENYTTAFTFPLGIHPFDYTPAKVVNSSNQTVSVSVQNYDSSLSVESNLDVSICGVAGNGMQRTWQIFGSNPAVSSTIYLQHNSSTNQSGFSSSAHYVTQFGNVIPNASGDSLLPYILSAWQVNTATAGSIGDLSTTGTVSSSLISSKTYTLETSSLSNLSYFSKASRAMNTKPFPPSFSSSLNICQGLPLSALSISKYSPSDTILWYTAASGGTGTTTATMPTTSATGTTTLYLSERKGMGCESARVPIVFTVNPTPDVPVIAADTLKYCQYETAMALSAVKGLVSDTLLWSSSISPTPSVAIPVINTSVVGTVVYSVFAKNAYNCQSSKDSVISIVNPLPVKPTVVSPVSYCNGALASALTATGTSLKWYNDSLSKTAIPLPTPSTTVLGSTYYYVSQTSALGCESKRAQIEVKVNANPYVKIKSLSLSGFTLCHNSNIKLLADKTSPSGPSPFTSQMWYFNGVPIGSALSKDTIIVDTNGIWTVEVSNAFGCKAKDEVIVNRDKSPLPVLSPTSLSICKGFAELLTCNPGFVSYKFDWMKSGIPLPGSSVASNIASANDTGAYSVIVTNNFGCIDTTNQAIVSFYPDPLKPTLTVVDTLLSLANKYTYYQWYKNGVKIFAANSFKYTSTAKGFYYVEVTDKNGCIVNSDTVNMNNTAIDENQFQAASIKIFPNPSTGLVQISSLVPLNIQVTDISGRKIMTVHNATQLDLSDYDDGIYFLHLFNCNDQIITVEKLVKASGNK